MEMIVTTKTVGEMEIEVETEMVEEMETEMEEALGMEILIGMIEVLCLSPNAHKRTIRADAAFAMSWRELMKLMTELRNEIQKMETEVWNLTVKGNDLTAYTQRFQELTMLCTKMVLEEEDRVEKFIGGLPNNIQGNMIASEPTRLQDAIQIANNLMDQKLKGYDAKSMENKRRLDFNQKDNRAQQPPYKRQNVGGQNVARAYTAGNNERRGYVRAWPYCNKCKLHHEGQCIARCSNCKKVRHMARDCKAAVATTTRGAPEPNQKVGAFYECRRQGHYRSDCPKLKNQIRGNKTGNKTNEARGKAYVLGGGDANLDSNVVTCMFLLNNRYVSMLFDSGADRSFVSTTISALLNVIPSTLDVSYAVELADSFDVIISMDWLKNHYAMIVCDEKIVCIPYGDEVLIVQVMEKETEDDFKKHNQLMKLMQFLMGLDDTYMRIRSSILSKETLPDVRSAYAIISIEESHRIGTGSVSGTSQRSHTSVFKVNTSNRGNFQRSQTSTSFSRPSNNNNRPNDNGNRRTARGSTLVCENCGFNGHTIDRCFKIIGYPPDFGKKKAGQNFKGKNVSNNAVGSSSSSSFSDEHLSDLISLIKENSINGKGVQANMAGTILNKSHLFNKNFEKFFCSNSMVHTKLETKGVIIDSRANQHITFTDKFLVNVIDISHLKIKVSHPNGTEAFITKIGNMPLTNYLTLFDVLVVPEYCVSLRSVHKVTRDIKLFIAFDELKCYILNQDLKAGKVLGTGRQFGGLYYFDRNQGLNRPGFPLSDHVSTELGELVHLDLWGPYKVTSRDGFRYFLTVVDDFSRAVWIFLLKNKTEVFDNMTIFYNIIHTQFNKKIKIFRSDNGTEFVNQKFTSFCESHGILHQTSCSYTPQQNGIVKRKHRHLLNVARALLFQEGLPLNMWTECILTTTYLINRLPSSMLNGKSPFELIYKRILSLKHLRSFGCLAYATIVNNTDKFGSRSKKCVLIGYSNYKKGYKLFSLDKKHIVFSRDVKFFEDIFPFKQKLDMSNEQSVMGLNNKDFFNLDGSIDHSEIPYDDERSDPNPSRYGTPSFHSGSTSNTHNENEGGHSLGSNAAASENDRCANPEDNDNNISEGNGPSILSQNDQNISETHNLRRPSRSSFFHETIMILCLINLAVQNGWTLYQMDVNNAFLYGDLNETVYMSLPLGYFPKDETRSKSDYSLFTKKFGDVFIALLVYVDVIIITGNNLNEINKFKQFLKTKFMIKDLGKLKYFLGIEVLENPTVFPNISLSSEPKDDDPFLDNITNYQKLIGKLIYLTTTRPDIAYIMSCLSQSMHSPLKSHLKTNLKVIRYLKGCPGKGVNVIRTSTSVNVLKAYTDADWARCTDKRRYVTGYCVFMNNSLISWKSKKQNTISKSSTEAEYRTLASVTSEVIWVLKILKDLDCSNLLPVKVFCDNSSAIKIADNPVFHERTKHLEIDLYFVREDSRWGN
ncbi:putative RNA-directed DNA polymerase [Tanacetum coccineum]|uniref:Gag-Pol-p199 n=1 Tax=Tanacetum coccineum TaxID=301880 RepID=A0ABQ5D3H7_9ASTR